MEKKNQKTKQKKTATAFSDIPTGATIYIYIKARDLIKPDHDLANSRNKNFKKIQLKNKRRLKKTENKLTLASIICFKRRSNRSASSFELQRSW
jgi:hypothetical protein